MSGAQVSSFPSNNILFDVASGQALQRGQANAQALGANEIEYLSRAAQGVLDLKRLISDIIPAQDAPRAYRQLDQDPSAVVEIVLKF